MSEAGVGIYDVYYYYTKDEQNKMEDFSDMFLRQLSQSLVFQIFAQAVRDACDLSGVDNPGEGVKFFLNNSNIFRSLFYELTVLRVVKSSESGDLGEILKNICSKASAFEIREDDEYVDFNVKIHAMIYTDNFHISKKVAELFKVSYDQKINRSVDPTKCLVYFVKKRKEKLFKKIQLSLVGASFTKEQAEGVIDKVKEFFNGRIK